MHGLNCNKFGEVAVKIISILIHMYMLMLIYELFTSKGTGFFRGIFLVLITTVKYGAELFLYTRYLTPVFVCALLVLYSVCIHGGHSRIRNLKCALVAYGMDFVINLVLAGICGAVAGLLGSRATETRLLILSAIRLLIIVQLIRKKDSLAPINRDWVINISMIMSIVWILAEQLIRVSYAFDHMQYVLAAVACSYLAVFFSVLWLMDHHQMEKRQQAYADDNARMSRMLHRSKEILPMIANYAGSLDGSMDEKLREKLEAVCMDYGSELEGDEMSAEVFETTGIDLLDLLLRTKIKECAKKGTELDVYVNTQIAKDMRRMDITDGEITRLIGDLLRNAIHAVEPCLNRMILLMIVRDEAKHVLIRVYDSGIPFRSEVLEHLGERGNTTWGTGNGLADMMELVNRVGASVEIQTEMDEGDLFTKAICIRFEREK